MMAATPTPRSRLSRADRMEQTLEVAHDLFAARGFAAVTMDDIAAEVGVTKPLLYNYFGNKERLYVACMERAGDALLATIEENVRPSSNPAELLNDGLLDIFCIVGENLGEVAVVDG